MTHYSHDPDPNRCQEPYDYPDPYELPTSGQLLRSTVIAVISAAAILVVAVLPAEYGVDPTGVGEVIGLTQMGRIKMQAERGVLDDVEISESTRLLDIQPDGGQVATQTGPETAPGPQADRIGELLAPTPSAPPPTATTPESAAPEPEAMSRPAEPQTAQPAVIAWRDEISVTLAPGEGIEYKLVMDEGTTAEFEWTANGGLLNFDTHGDGGGQSVSYEKGRGAAEDAGDLTAAFTGNHGWFWRNRTEQDVTLTFRTRGNYVELKRTA